MSPSAASRNVDIRPPWQGPSGGPLVSTQQHAGGADGTCRIRATVSDPAAQGFARRFGLCACRGSWARMWAPGTSGFHPHPASAPVSIAFGAWTAVAGGLHLRAGPESSAPAVQCDHAAPVPACLAGERPVTTSCLAGRVGAGCTDEDESGTEGRRQGRMAVELGWTVSIRSSRHGPATQPAGPGPLNSA